MSKHQTTEIDPIINAFKALGHRHRLQIFLQLANCCCPRTICDSDEAAHRCVGELAQELDIAPSTVSHHIKELINAGLIATERRGRNIRCWIEPGVLKMLSNVFTQFNAPQPEKEGTKS
jgi:ArsR family transcriptional regulator